jgi:type VI secretion system protein ImpA
MPLRDDLLNPIPGDNPAGADLRYDPLYDKIKEARREDDDAPQGEWARARKTADWPQVIKLAGDALATKTKDLQLAAWLTEALLRKEGAGGLRDGLRTCSGLLEQFWDGLYPEAEDGDLEMRAAPLEWVGLKLDTPVRMIPLVKGGWDLLAQREARAIGYEADATDDAKLERRSDAISAGRPTLEDWDKAFDATPKPWYKSLVADLAAAKESLDALDNTGRERFGPDAPSYGKLRDALEEVSRSAQSLLKAKLEKDPDPMEMAPEPGTSMVTTGGGALVASESSAATVSAGPEPVSREDAAARVALVARWLRRADPKSPAPYLMLRGLRWGELRAAGNPPDPRLLDAPPTQVRTQLKRLLLDGQWAQLLELAETVMGTAQGRGWLDLQRYALSACDQLGADYHHVAEAIRSELRALLADLPALLDMTLMDDTPTANGETRAWLASLVAGGNGVVTSASAGTPAEGFTAMARDRALAEVRAGHPERAIQSLMSQVQREKTRRGRFLGQTLLAGIMVDAGHDAVAMPILEELVQSIDAYKLDEWEAGETVAQPMALLYRCLTNLGGDEGTRQALYLRICRLDPLRAIEFSQAQQQAAAAAE